MHGAKTRLIIDAAPDGWRATLKEAALSRKSPKGPRIVGGDEFTSYASLWRYIQAMLYHYELHAHVGEEDEAFLRDLLTYHPRGAAKVAGSPVTHFEKHRTKHGPECFYLVREDGSLEDFGTEKCAKACFS